jgi:hypothetical protein
MFLPNLREYMLPTRSQRIMCFSEKGGQQVFSDCDFCTKSLIRLRCNLGFKICDLHCESSGGGCWFLYDFCR